MDDHRLLDLFDRSLRRAAPPESPRHTVDRDERIVRQTGPDADSWNGVVWSRLTAQDADEVIAGQIAHYRRLSLSFEWKLYSHDTPADLPGRLTAAGFTADAPETLLLGDAHALPPASVPTGGITLREADDETGLELAAEVHRAAFGGDGGRWISAVRAGLADGTGRHRITVAMDGDRPVAAARLELFPGTAFAGLYGGGTVPGHRGRGIYRALVAHRAAHAAAHGHRWLQVDAAPTSRPILQRLGFRALAVTTPYRYDPAPPPPAA